MKYLVLSLLLIIFGWNFYLYKSNISRIDHPDEPSHHQSLKQIHPPTQAPYQKSSIPQRPIWESPDFKKHASELSHIKPSSPEVREEQIRLKAQDIIKRKLDQYIGTQHHPELKSCRGTIAYRELTHSLMALIQQHGYSDLDFVENSSHIDFQELFFEHQMEPATILSICANSLNGPEKETIMRRIASLKTKNNAQAPLSDEDNAEDFFQENTLEPTPSRVEDENEGDNN